ncbi:MAG: NAD(P)H-dependent oxidoreductase [Gallionellaceae bacterium]|nr:NAD(P)H-dependent oxidoreductase [Gallionellaceae bacterium]MDD5364212.1 NAD(P)H-dependent oxidoreductase [Gallionellaceae bacterium]
MIDPQTVLEAFHFRHACKEFDPAQKIPAEAFDMILEAGRLSPSSFGYEPWQFVVIQNPELRGQLLPVTWGAQKQLPTSSHYVAILVRKGGLRYDGEHIRHMLHDIYKFPPERVEGRNKVYRKFQESDFKLLESERALFDWGCKQAYIALGNMMTAAALIGIDSCPVEGYDQAEAEAVLAGAGVLDTREWGLAVMVAFGYRVNPQSAKVRQPMADVVRWFD